LNNCTQFTIPVLQNTYKSNRCVHSVKDSILILIAAPFCFSLFLKGSPQFSPNRYT